MLLVLSSPLYFLERLLIFLSPTIATEISTKPAISFWEIILEIASFILFLFILYLLSTKIGTGILSITLYSGHSFCSSCVLFFLLFSKRGFKIKLASFCLLQNPLTHYFSGKLSD